MDLLKYEGLKMSQEELARLFPKKIDPKLLKILKIKRFMAIQPAWNLKG